MRHRFLQLIAAALVALTASTVSAQAEQWKVDPDDERRSKIVARYQQLLLRNPDQPHVLRALLAKVGTGPALQRVIASVRRELEHRPDAEAWILLGHLLSARGDTTEALDATRRATVLAPDSSSAFTALAAALSEAGRTEESERAYRRALELAGDGRAKRRLLRTLVDRSLAASDLRAAIRWYAELIEEKPGSYDLRVEYAETLLRARRFDEALDAYEQALKRAGRSGKRRAQLHTDIGTIHRQLHDPVAAAASYRKALEFTGRNNWMRREILMRLVEVHRDTNQLPEMYEELKREWHRPNYHDSMVLAGLAEELGRAEDTVRWLERAARLDRRAVEPRKRLLARMERDGERERVEELYAELLAIRPDDLPQRLERIEWLYFRKEQVERALTLLRELEASRRDDPDALVEIAATWQRFGLIDESMRIYRTTSETHPDNVANIEAYGAFLARLGKRERAEETWSRLLEVDDSLRTRSRLAELTTRAGYHGWSVDLLEDCVEEAPRVPSVRQRLAAAYQRTKAWDDALGQWEILYREHGASHAARRIVSIAERTFDPAILDHWEEAYEESKSPRLGIVVVRLRLVFRKEVEALELAAEIADLDPAGLARKEHGAWVEAVTTTVSEIEHVRPREASELLERLGDAFGDQRVRAAQRMTDIALEYAGGDEALEMIGLATRMAPNDPYVHAQAGYFYGDRLELDRAIEHLERAVALGPRSFAVHLDLVAYLTQRDRRSRAREVLLEVIRGDWTGKWAQGAAFSAIDLCETDAELRELEREVRRMEGRVPKEAFHAMMVGIYSWLFVYADDPESAFEDLAGVALEPLVESVPLLDDADRKRAMALLRLYPAEHVARLALRRWRDEATWNVQMLWIVARGGVSGSEGRLIEALTSEDPDMRRMALFGLGQMKARASQKALSRLALDTDAPIDERILAVTSLGRISTSASEKTLTELAAGTGPSRLRLAATWALGFTETERTAELIADRLGDEDGDVRRVAAATLSRFRRDAGFRALLQAYWGTDGTRRAVAEQGLRLGPTAIPSWPLVDERRTLEDPTVRIEHALTDLDAVANGSEPSRPVVRAFARRPAVVVDVARDRLRDARVREVILSDLVEVADDAGDGELLPVVRRVVSSLRPELREFARSEEVSTFVPAARLLPIAEEPDDIPTVMNAATRATSADAERIAIGLSRYEWSASRDQVVVELRAQDAARRRAALRVIQRVGAEAKEAEAIELIDTLIDDPDSGVRVAAIKALGALKHDASTDRLMSEFAEADYPTRLAIVESLRAMETEEATAAVRQLLVVPIHQPCEGDPEDLSELLEDACVGVFDASDL